MDIDEQGGIILPDGSPGQDVVLPQDILPGVLQVIAQESRPFFPGQAIPLLLDAERWKPTLQTIQERKLDVVGLIATRGELPENVAPENLFEMGTACRIHRINQAEGHIQILLEGLQRFPVRKFGF